MASMAGRGRPALRRRRGRPTRAAVQRRPNRRRTLRGAERRRGRVGDRHDNDAVAASRTRWPRSIRRRGASTKCGPPRAFRARRPVDRRPCDRPAGELQDRCADLDALATCESFALVSGLGAWMTHSHRWPQAIALSGAVALVAPGVATARAWTGEQAARRLHWNACGHRFRSPSGARAATPTGRPPR
jgi:hypothetical protein